MDKYEVLEEKLTNIVKYIDSMSVSGEQARAYLLKYKFSIENRIKFVHNKTIRDSHGALLGLIKGISDYDEICADDQLWEMLCDAEDYYSIDCYEF